MNRSLKSLSAFVSQRFTKALFIGLGLLGLAQTQSYAVPTVYIIGDSTVASYSSGSIRGWGQYMYYFISSSKATISDKAVAGTSSKSFYNTYWSAIKSSLKSGDYVMIQFGINDAATDTARHTDPSTTFKTYLTNFCNETKSKGAQPILVSTLCRDAWNSDGVTIYPAYHGYPVATRELASAINVPLVDLDKLSIAYCQAKGKAYVDANIYVSDHVHLTSTGALTYAGLVSQGYAGIAGLESIGTWNGNVAKLLPLAHHITF